MLSGQRKKILQVVFAGLFVFSDVVFALKFEPGVGVGVEFTDNADLTSDLLSNNRTSDSIFVGYVGASLQENEDEINYDINASLSKHIYLEDSFSDQQYFKFGASASWEMIRNQLEWFVSDKFAQRPIQELTSNTPDNLQDSNTFTFGANINFLISPIQSFTLVPKLDRYYYEEQATDNQQFSLAATWNYQAFRLTKVGLNLTARNVDYSEDNSVGQSSADTDFFTSSIIFNTQFRRSNFIVNLGTTSVERDDALNTAGFSGSGFVGSASWTADLTKTSTLNTRFATNLTDTSTVAFSADSPENSSVDNLEVTTDVVRNSLFHLTYIRDDASLNSRYWLESRKVRYSGNLLTRETQAVGLNYSLPLTRLLSSSAYLQYNRTRQLETFRTDKRYTAGVSFKYRLSRKIKAVFDVKFRKKSSNSAADNYDESSLFARLVYGFGDVDRPTRAGGF